MLINCLASPILKFIHHGSKLYANALCVMRIYEVFGKSFHIDCIFGTSDICRLNFIYYRSQIRWLFYGYIRMMFFE